jgi:hypothetical protein
MRKALRLSAAIAAVCVLTALIQAQVQTTEAISYKEKVLLPSMAQAMVGYLTRFSGMQRETFMGLTLTAGIWVADATPFLPVVGPCLNSVRMGNSG